MEHIWWLYLLVFVFGYFTCKTFYLFREAKLGLTLLRLSHYLSLYTITKGIENLEYTKTMRINYLRKSEETDNNINAYKLNFDTEIKLYKDKCIREIINMHPKFYQELIDYKDWDSAMSYLNNGGLEFIQRFNNRS